MNRLKTIIINVCRLLLAVTFILSGYVKAIDPLGTQYKIQDYLEALSWQGLAPGWLTLTASVALSALEFSLGIFILLAIRRRIVSKVALILMMFMMGMTLWLAIANPISDCGCFGDAVKLTNIETLLKNIVLLACSIVLAIWPMKMWRFISRSNQWIVFNYTIFFIIASSLYSLYYLPPFDFRPYHVGTDIKKGMEIPQGAPQPKFETTFTMQKKGVTKKFNLDNYPDSTWTLVDSKTIQLSEGYVPPIHDFFIQKQDGEDITDQILSDSNYIFLLIAPHLEKASDSNFGDIDRIYEYAQTYHYPLYCLTSSTTKPIKHWQELTGAEYPFYQTDDITLKTMIRSNPGLILLKHGVVIRKWSHNELPKDEDLKGPLTELPIGKVPPNSAPKKITIIFSWFILPLMLLTIADRLWAWTQRRKKKKHRKHLYQLLKRNRKMRKKIVAGNWKMNLNLQEGVALAKEINEAMTAENPNCGVIICTPFIHLASVAAVLDQNLVALGAENCADKEQGAYTGEVSAEMVKSTGAQYVILGHSERRQYYNETPEILKEKVLLALKNNLKVIFCIGETLDEREANKQEEVCKAELAGSVFNLSAEDFKNIVIAYEPIWAIGTGKTATAEQAEEIHAFVRSTIAEKYGEAVAEDTTILYGGSCKASNAPELFAKPNIDGGLIGGASLKTADFKGIIDAWKK